MKNALRPLAVLATHCYAARRVWVKGNMLRTIVFGGRPGFLDWAGPDRMKTNQRRSRHEKYSSRN
jgi:hypothetical protein